MVLSDASPPDALEPTVLTRRGILQIMWGPEAFRKIVLNPGEQVTFGRTDRANVVINDPKLNGVHFSVWWSGARAIVRDLESAGGVFANGKRTSRGEIHYGGFFVAGSTTFMLFWEGLAVAPPGEARKASIATARKELGAIDGCLYAVLDSARSAQVLPLLQESIDDHSTLYEGQAGRLLDAVAPYLVRFTRDSGLLDRLLVSGWGDAWGIFIRSTEHPKEVRRQMRRFLMVLDDATSERMYFRFYDPRVMREFQAIATARQRAELLHGILRMVLEAEDGTPLVLCPAISEAS